jgi:hypothetical protein
MGLMMFFSLIEIRPISGGRRHQALPLAHRVWVGVLVGKTELGMSGTKRGEVIYIPCIGAS